VFEKVVGLSLVPASLAGLARDRLLKLIGSPLNKQNVWAAAEQEYEKEWEESKTISQSTGLVRARRVVRRRALRGSRCCLVASRSKELNRKWQSQKAWNSAMMHYFGDIESWYLEGRRSCWL